MSLSAILNTASSGIANADFRIAVANGNVANADDPAYARKTAQFAAATPAQALSTATVTRVADAYLTRTTADATATAGRADAVSSALQTYDAALGTVGSGDDVSSLLTAFQTSVTNLAGAGATTAAKSEVVSSASQLALGLRGLSATVQSLRTQANSDIATTVGAINTAASSIASLNDQIVSTAAGGGDVTDLEDQRDAALQTLAGDIGVSYFTTPDNRVQVYTAGGQPLVAAQAVPLSYTASSNLGPTATYPGQISGVMLGGKDITGALSTGKLGGLIQLRDSILPGEQSKLDQMAGALIATTNAVSNAGAAYPAPSTVTGSRTVAASDPLSATGALRVVVTNSAGGVAATQDLNLSSFATVGDLVSALNGVPGLSASVSASGKLTLSANASGAGVALADIGASVAPSGSGVSDYFGLNDVFSGADATDIGVSASLQNNPAGLPTAAVATTGALTIGAAALAYGDTSVADRLTAALSGAQSFTAQSTSLQSYAAAFVSGAATTVAGASADADNADAAFSAAQTRLQNLTSVNTDQELALLVNYQQQYQANAQMITTVRALFAALMTMMA
jgi:flagellar hook-associated protein 1 FlgK